MSTATAPKVIAEPGDEIMSGNTSDPEAAIVAAQQGRARRVLKPKPQVPEAVVERPDTLRPLDAPVNAKREMSYEDAMALVGRMKVLRKQADLISREIKRLEADFEGDLDANLARIAELQAKFAEIDAQIPKRSILTEKGWVVIERPLPPGVGRV